MLQICEQEIKVMNCIKLMIIMNERAGTLEIKH